jgi:hypothetical protein
MIKIMLIVSCLAASYFFVFLVIANHWGQALMYGIYGSLVFSLGFACSQLCLPGYVLAGILDCQYRPVFDF